MNKNERGKEDETFRGETFGKNVPSVARLVISAEDWLVSQVN